MVPPSLQLTCVGSLYCVVLFACFGMKAYVGQAQFKLRDDLEPIFLPLPPQSAEITVCVTMLGLCFHVYLFLCVKRFL